MHVIKLKVKIIVEEDGESFHAYCPDLKGLHAGGDTKEEALSAAIQAVQLYVESLIKHDDPIPVGVLDGKPWSMRQWLSGVWRSRSSSSYVREVQLPVAA